MHRLRSFRALFLLSLLLIAGMVLLLREHRPSFLRPDLHLNAYVAAGNGSVAVVDLASLKITARVLAGPGLSGMREHPSRPEIWGVSTQGGYAWVLDAKTNQVARIQVGPLPYVLDFSPDGRYAFTTASGADSVIAIDCQTRVVAGRAKTGRQPVLARVTPDGNTLLVVNKGEGTLEIRDARTLQLRTKVAVIPEPEDAAVLPDSSLAFVMSRTEPSLSVVDLQRGVLLTNLELAGRPTQMLLKPDGGELYVISPQAHGLQAINTWTHEVGDYMLLGAAPTRGLLTRDGTLLYALDAEAGRVVVADILNRRLARGDNGREVLIPAGQSPAALRFDPNEDLLLVANRDSGDLSVIRMRTNSVVTMIPIGEKPQGLAVKLF